MEPKSLLAILAHPDDESFGPGATLAKYALAGVSVNYLCGTRGEMGTTDAEHMVGYTETGDMRWAELTCAGKELGLAGIYHLGYRDSGMQDAESNNHPNALTNQPVEDVAARIAHMVRKLRPQVIITHDTIGGYRHPDHIMLNRATLLFFEKMHDPTAFPDPEGLPDYYPQKLYYAIFSRAFLKLAARALPLFGRDPHKFGRNGDIDLISLTNVDFPTHTVIDVKGEPLLRKQKASDCHKSQLAGGPPRTGPMALVARLMGFSAERESYMRAFPVVPDGVKLKETDLFEGVK
jgi:N-acetyl-1-D-myo-inositol-2-amino-2-deoxy-alpha-D-glucopyranoside deacetylase/mycothiol S-conjugate amidase